MQQIRCLTSYHGFSEWSPTISASQRDLSADCHALQIEISDLRAKLHRQKDRFRRQKKNIKALSQELDKTKVQRYNTLPVRRARGPKRNLVRERLNLCDAETLGSSMTASRSDTGSDTDEDTTDHHRGELISNTKFRVKVQAVTGEETAPE